MSNQNVIVMWIPGVLNMLAFFGAVPMVPALMARDWKKFSDLALRTAAFLFVSGVAEMGTALRFLAPVNGLLVVIYLLI